MAVIYGSGALYGDGELYGRLDAFIANAIASSHRETGLQVTLTDTNLNEWVYRNGANFDPATYSPDSNATLQAYKGYREPSHVIKLSGGNIIRARIGDGSYADRSVYVQTITDPTIDSQWTSWSLLYSGSHYALWLIPTGASTYDVVHAKSDGVYINNVKKSNLTNVITLRASYPTSGNADDLFAIQVIVDPLDGAGKYRDLKLWGVTSRSAMSAGTLNAGNEFYESPLNYRWYRFGIAPIYDTALIRNGRGGLLCLPLYTDPRSRNTGDTLVMCDFDQKATNFVDGPMVIRGLGAGGTHNTIAGSYVTKMGDGYYYLFYNEYHSDADFESNVSLGVSVVWQRSKDLYHWSEPVFTGFQTSIAGVVESGSYAYFASFNAVWRRPIVATTYSLENYIPSLQLEIPRDNQAGSGSATVANPGGVNDAIVSIASDKPLDIKLGIKGTDGVFQYFTLDQWWVKRATKVVQGVTNHIELEFGNLWERLNNPIRDTFNFIGRTLWHDWWDGGQNKAFNYYFVSGTVPAFNLNSMTIRGICLWTGWKGHTGYAKVHWSARDGNEGIIFRYIDSKNYFKAEFDTSSTMKLYMVRSGITTQIGSTLSGCSHNTTIVDFFWKTIKFGDDPGHLQTYTLADNQVLGKPGYVGFKSKGGYTIDDFYFNDREYDIRTGDLVKTALAMGDFHEVQVDIVSSSRQMDVIWGPQTDLPTIAEALSRALEIEKWELVWRDGLVRVGKFTDPSPVKTLQNEIISTDYQDEASRRVNLSMVDGNEDTWIEVDEDDVNVRDRQINSYFDVPELLDPDAVQERAIEEIRRGKTGRSPGGETIYQPDLWRMDAINWVDNSGATVLVRLEGFSLEVEQGLEPTQKQTWDTSLVNA